MSSRHMRKLQGDHLPEQDQDDQDEGSGQEDLAASRGARPRQRPNLNPFDLVRR